MKVSLTKQHWYHSNNVWVTGFIREDNRYLEEYDLLKYFDNIDTADKFEKILFNANGQFSVIIENTHGLWAATDRLRNFPLFYSYIDREFTISDDCYWLADLLPGKKFNKDALDCFLLVGFTVNNLTLIEGIFQVEAGEFISAGESVKRKYYYSSVLPGIVEIDFRSATIVLEEVLNEVFKNHFEALSSRFIAIPLSGGFDSRLVASMCSKYHPDNVLCYTYGRRENREVAPAREAASRLGLKWINIVYDQELIKDYMIDKYFKQYYEYTSGLSSMFYMQDYFAVKYLKENNIVPDDTVFMPGFSGDSLAGSFFVSSFEKHKGKHQIAARIVDDKFVLIDLDRQKKENICRLVREKISDNIAPGWKNYEEWEIKEIHAKFIINSAKVFRFFGYSYVLPLFDNQLIDFFTSLPFGFKLHKKLYDHLLTEKIFRELDVNLADEINPEPVHRSIQRLKERGKRVIPKTIVNRLIELKSPIFYDEITRFMIEEIGKENILPPRQANYYNSYLTQWYLMKTREKFNLSDY